MSERPPHTESELIELLRSVDVPAPEELRRRIEALLTERAQRRRPSLGPWAFGGLAAPGRRLAGAVAILAAATVVLVLALTGGGPTPLNVREVSALTLRPATMAGPSENPHRPAQLAAAVDGVAFPYWEDRFGWRSTGARTDRIGGRSVTTVFYSYGRNQRLGYAIVGGTPAPAVAGGVVIWRDGTLYRLLRENGAWIVTWLRDGHLCVVTGRDVNSTTLLGLASWHDGGAAA